MATETLIRAYRRERQQWRGPVPYTTAKDAFASARWALKKRPVADATEQEIALPGGWRIEIQALPDDTLRLQDAIGCDQFEQDPRRWTGEQQAGDGWVSRDGRVRIDAGRDARGWFSFEDGYAYADRVRDARRAGMARHDAWLAARRWTATQANYCREILTGAIGFYGVIVTLRDEQGKRIAKDSCWGFESSYPVDRNDMVLDTVRHYRGLHIEALEAELQYAKADANALQDSARALDVRMRTLFAELKSQGPLMPSVCTALRDQIKTLRKQRSDARRQAKDARCLGAQLRETLAHAQQLDQLFQGSA